MCRIYFLPWLCGSIEYSAPYRNLRFASPNPASDNIPCPCLRSSSGRECHTILAATGALYGLGHCCSPVACGCLLPKDCEGPEGGSSGIAKLWNDKLDAKLWGWAKVGITAWRRACGMHVLKHFPARWEGNCFTFSEASSKPMIPGKIPEAFPTHLSLWRLFATLSLEHTLHGPCLGHACLQRHASSFSSGLILFNPGVFFWLPFSDRLSGFEGLCEENSRLVFRWILFFPGWNSMPCPMMGLPGWIAGQQSWWGTFHVGNTWFLLGWP